MQSKVDSFLPLSLQSFDYIGTTGSTSALMQLLNLPAPNNIEHKFIHKKPHYKKEDIFSLYDCNNPLMKVGTTKDLHHGIYTLNYILRYTIGTKTGRHH